MKQTSGGVLLQVPAQSTKFFSVRLVQVAGPGKLSISKVNVPQLFWKERTTQNDKNSILFSLALTATSIYCNTHLWKKKKKNWFHLPHNPLLGSLKRAKRSQPSPKHFLTVLVVTCSCLLRFLAQAAHCGQP